MTDITIPLDLPLFLGCLTLAAMYAVCTVITCSLVLYQWREAKYCARRRDRRLRLKAALARHTATASSRS